MRAVAADHVPREDLFPAAVAMAQDSGHGVVVRGQVGDPADEMIAAARRAADIAVNSLRTLDRHAAASQSDE